MGTDGEIRSMGYEMDIWMDRSAGRDGRYCMVARRLKGISEV
jgi:hypothetical protein